jgi:hypothetical protein
LACSDSIGPDSALTLKEQATAGSFLLGAFSFAEKEKEQPLTIHSF